MLGQNETTSKLIKNPASVKPANCSSPPERNPHQEMRLPPLLLLLLLLLQLLILLSSSHFNHSAQGRSLLRVLSISNELGGEEKVMGRILIGSRPPRCERRCKNCEHCEAVQVPVIPQEEEEKKKKKKKKKKVVDQSKRLWFLGMLASNFRGDYNSNYKPLSWKCKCGDVLFNP